MPGGASLYSLSVAWVSSFDPLAPKAWRPTLGFVLVAAHFRVWRGQCYTRHFMSRISWIHSNNREHSCIFDCFFEGKRLLFWKIKMSRHTGGGGGVRASKWHMGGGGVSGNRFDLDQKMRTHASTWLIIQKSDFVVGHPLSWLH